jgi:hypothetical protein
MKSTLNPAAAPLSLIFDCRVARGVGGLGLAIGYLVVSPAPHALFQSSAQASTQAKFKVMLVVLLLA